MPVWSVLKPDHVLQRARTTPDLLLLATVAVILAGLVSGGLGLQGFRGRADALDRARAETAHQALLQIVRTRAVIADTAAADDVLRGTERKPIAEREFEYAVEPAVTGVVVGARQADAVPLAIANRWLARYVQQVDNARTRARAGDADAAARTLTAASALLRAEVLPPLVTAQKASQARLADDETAATRGGLLGLLGALLALLVLAGVHWWLTLRTRRLVNLGLAGAMVLLLAIGLAGLVAVTLSRHRAEAVQDGAQLVARTVVEARVAAFDARGRESLAVIGGDLADADADWQRALDTADAALVRARTGGTPAVRAEISATAALLDRYGEQHARLLTLARNGDTARVRTQAASADGSAGTFEDFDATSGALLARQVQVTDDGWASAGRNLRLIGWLSLVVGLVAGGCAWSGLTARTREYR